MKRVIFVLTIIILTFGVTTRAYSQEKDNMDEKIVIKRYIVERTFVEGLNIPANEKGCDILQGVVSNNAKDMVSWVHSYVSKDKKKTYCIYDGPSPESIKNAAERSGLPVDNITEVSVLDPYFYN